MPDDTIGALLNLATFGVDSVRPQAYPPDFEALEADIAKGFPTDVALRFPAAIREVYRWSFAGAQVGPVRLIDAPVGDPLAQLREQIFDFYDPGAIAGQGLLVIADDGNDGGPLCLRAEQGVPADAWSVWLWDHEDGGVTDRLFSSADKMIEVLRAIQDGSTVSEAAGLDPGTDLASSRGWWDS